MTLGERCFDLPGKLDQARGLAEVGVSVDEQDPFAAQADTAPSGFEVPDDLGDLRDIFRPENEPASEPGEPLGIVGAACALIQLVVLGASQARWRDRLVVDPGT